MKSPAALETAGRMLSGSQRQNGRLASRLLIAANRHYQRDDRDDDQVYCQLEA
jgi:hypothetical protein